MAQPIPLRPEGRPLCVLALQGGGALGAYHIGAYEALAEHGFAPEWISGTSIGAINAAILAGNPPERRLARLEAFWDRIAWPQFVEPPGILPLDIWHNALSNLGALAFGQPHFFVPRPLNPFLAPPGPPTAASFYDTAPLRETLRALVDFDLINHGPVRLTLGATDVETGEVRYFDSADRDHPIGPEHVMASGALPPGFAAVEIGGRYYWDGGCVSNTPAEAVVEDQPPGHTLIFMIDLWDAAGPPPATMCEVLWRAKQIQYASRGHLVADALAMKANLRQAAAAAAARGRRGGGREDARRLDILHIIHHPGPDTIPNSDAEFSRSSIRARREAGYRDMADLLARRPWEAGAARAAATAAAAAPSGGQGGAVLHRVKGGRIHTHPAPGMERSGNPSP